MSDPRILVVFTTVDGHTRKVATRLAKTLTGAGLGAVLADLERVTEPLQTEDLGGVVVAGPVRFARHPRRLRSFVRRNREALSATGSAFVSVSAAAMSEDPEATEEARGYVDRFVEKTGWRPDRTHCAGGALAYTRYNPVVRLVMQSIARKAGLATDTSRDHVYTDWEALDAFGEELGGLVRKRHAARPPKRAPER